MLVFGISERDKEENGNKSFERQIGNTTAVDDSRQMMGIHTNLLFSTPKTKFCTRVRYL